MYGCKYHYFRKTEVHGVFRMVVSKAYIYHSVAIFYEGKGIGFELTDVTICRR